MSLQSGHKLAHYEILEPIGKGGMGEVYRAKDSKLGRDVAIKVLPDEFARDEERLRRFQREAKAIAALNHPHIVQIYSVEEAEDGHFITMEHVRGKSLSALVPKKGLSRERLLDIAVPLADAVSAAHGQGITHRDLKPGNILLSDEGRVKVLDFGLARLAPESVDAPGASESPTRSRTEDGHIVGTVGYMSPEQVEARVVDQRSDIFSLGIVLYEMATGAPPFVGDSKAAVLSSTLRDTPTDLPDELGRIVRRCLIKDPERRLQSAKDLRNELEELRSGNVPSTPQPVANSWRTAFVVTMVMALAAVSAALWFLPGETDLSETTPNLTQITSSDGLEWFPSLSPDSTFIVYAGGGIYPRRGGGNSDIYLQRVGGTNAVNLTENSPWDDTQPAFSPDGAYIAFRSEREGGGIFVMGATGESVRRLSDFGFLPSWSSDGTQIAVASTDRTEPASTAWSELWVLDVDTGEARLLYEGDASQPAWSPNDRRIAFWGNRRTSMTNIWSISADGGEPVPVTVGDTTDWSPVWSPDGSYLYFSSDRGGTLSLWRVAMDEASGAVRGNPELVSSAVTSQMYHLSLSHDGQRLAYSAFERRANIVKVRFDSEREIVVGEPETITTGANVYTYLDISPDGDWLAARNEQFTGRYRNIELLRTDGSEERRLTDDNNRTANPRWSPDGTTIAFYSNRTDSGTHEIFIIHRDGSGLRQLTRDPERLMFGGTWSPDGTRLSFWADPLFGPGVFDPRKPWDSQEPEILGIPDGIGFSRHDWSPDGRQLAGVYRLGNGAEGIATYSFQDREFRQLTDFSGRPVWLSDSRRLLTPRPEGDLILIDTESGDVREVTALGLHPFYGLAISDDDRWIYFAPSETRADIWMLALDPPDR